MDRKTQETLQDFQLSEITKLKLKRVCSETYMRKSHSNYICAPDNENRREKLCEADYRPL